MDLSAMLAMSLMGSSTRVPCSAARRCSCPSQYFEDARRGLCIVGRKPINFTPCTWAIQLMSMGSAGSDDRRSRVNWRPPAISDIHVRFRDDADRRRVRSHVPGIERPCIQ